MKRGGNEANPGIRATDGEPGSAAPQPERARPEGSPTPPAKRRYRRRLANLQNVRCGLADVIHMAESGEVEPGKARVLIYGLATLAAVIKDEKHLDEVDGRLAALEEALRASLTRNRGRPSLLNPTNHQQPPSAA